MTLPDCAPFSARSCSAKTQFPNRSRRPSKNTPILESHVTYLRSQRPSLLFPHCALSSNNQCRP